MKFNAAQMILIIIGGTAAKAVYEREFWNQAQLEKNKPRFGPYFSDINRTPKIAK